MSSNKYGMSLDDLTPAERIRVGHEVAEGLARGRHADYDTKVKAVMPKLRDDASFRDAIYGAPDPAEALYKAGTDELHPSLEKIFGED